MNNLIKYLLYLLVLLLLVSWIITVGKSCGKTETPPAQVESFTTQDEPTSLEDVEEDIDFDEELESILEEEEEAMLNTKESPAETEALDYSSYDPSKDKVVETKEEVKSTPPPKVTSKPAPKKEVNQPVASSSGRYMVIAGSFIHPDYADNMKKKVSNQGFPAEVVVFDLSEFHTVIAGRYKDFDAAQGVVNKLSAKGIDAYVKKQTF